jgi:transcriptional regulator with PAS, ATPase and Fis domain
LFLDEIATLSLSAQSKILRALQEGEIERVGGTAPIRVDVRIIAATNLDLRREVEAGRFREDLFYRLNVFPIHLPPLRERREDIPLLMSYFLRHFSLRHGRKLAGFSTRLVNALLTYRFPGNIRELQNLIERGVIAAGDGEVIDMVHLAEAGAPLMATAIGLTLKGVCLPFSMRRRIRCRHLRNQRKKREVQTHFASPFWRVCRPSFPGANGC